jgi:hypothetical protein
MPLTVWMAFAVLAFGSVTYLVGILLFDDFLALFSEKKMSGLTISAAPRHTTADELVMLELHESGTFVKLTQNGADSSPERRCQPLLSSKLHKPAAGLANLPGSAPKPLGS